MRRLGLHAAAAVFVVAFVALGFWQLDRARAQAGSDAGAEAPAAPLTAVLDVGETMPADAAGRLVTARGSYDAAQQLLVDRDSARWVVTPLLVGDGTAVVVVRGAVGTTTVPAVPIGESSVTGRLQPSEAGGLADGSINTAELIQHVPYDLYDGYLVLTDRLPGLEPVAASRTSGSRPGFPLQNTAYAIQWWLFAGFTILVWWRLVRDRGQRPADDARGRVSLVP